MFPVPDDVIREAMRIIFKFLWKGRDRVKRNAVINTYENGGLKVLDFDTMVKSLRLTWLRRFYSGEDAGWKSYLRLLLKSYGGDFLFHCDYDPKDYDIANKFYSEVVSSTIICLFKEKLFCPKVQKHYKINLLFLILSVYQRFIFCHAMFVLKLI